MQFCRICIAMRIQVGVDTEVLVFVLNAVNNKGAVYRDRRCSKESKSMFEDLFDLDMDKSEVIWL